METPLNIDYLCNMENIKNMDIQAKKLELFQMLLNVNEASILKKVEKILKKGKTADWWDGLSKEAKKTLEESLGEAERGETIPHEEAMKEAKAKFSYL